MIAHLLVLKGQLADVGPISRAGTGAPTTLAAMAAEMSITPPRIGAIMLLDAIMRTNRLLALQYSFVSHQQRSGTMDGPWKSASCEVAAEKVWHLVPFATRFLVPMDSLPLTQTPISVFPANTDVTLTQSCAQINDLHCRQPFVGLFWPATGKTLDLPVAFQ